MTSKKPSATKRPPEGEVFFIDRCLGGKALPRALAENGVVAVSHDSEFPRDTPDDMWLKRAAARGWVVLTKDKRIRYNPMELDAVLANGGRVFVLTAGSLDGEGIAAAFLRAMPSIRKMLLGRRPPFIATVNGSGRVRLLKPRPRPDGARRSPS